jgi:hypothetical protein
MTRLCLRTFDPILIALVRGAGAGLAALIVLGLSKSRTPDRGQLVRLGSAAVGMVFFSDPGLNRTAVCPCDPCVGARIDSATCDRCLWSGPRTRKGFAGVLDICDSRDLSDRPLFGVSIGVSFG